MRLTPAKNKTGQNENAHVRSPEAVLRLLDRAPFGKALDSLSRTRALDPAIGPLQRAVRKLPLGPYRDALHGTWLGHPLHPALVQVPMGAWLSAGVLDLLPGTHRSSRALVGVGILAALPTALAGWVDWAEQHEQQMRTGLVHAASNTVGLVLYTASFTARVRGRGVRGRLLGYAALTAAGGGAMLGGHLAYRQAAGANKTEPVPHLLDEGWHEVAPVKDLPVGEPVRKELGEVPLLVFRESTGEVRVLADRCSHLSGPLHEGEVSDGCVTCPWHGSVFRLSDGWNVAGPATAPQPSFLSRVRDDGVLEVCLPGAG